MIESERVSRAAPRAIPAARDWLFGSFFLGGFECSTHLGRDGRRHDLVAATQHDVLAAEDYALDVARVAVVEQVPDERQSGFPAEPGQPTDLADVDPAVAVGDRASARIRKG